MTSYFQETFTRVLEGLECMVWVDDVLFGGLDETDLVNTQDLILERLEEVGLYVAAHKGITLCGKVYSQGQVRSSAVDRFGDDEAPRDCR